MLWPSHNLIEHDGRHYMYFSATEGLHGDPASKSPSIWPFFSAICRASWAVNRYWAAVSGPGGDVVGTLTTHPLPVGGKQLILNAATSTVTEGALQAELLDPEGHVVEGFSKDDYIPWHGIARRRRRAGPAGHGVRWRNARFGFTWSGLAFTGTPGRRPHSYRLAGKAAPIGARRLDCGRSRRGGADGGRVRGLVGTGDQAPAGSDRGGDPRGRSGRR